MAQLSTRKKLLFSAVLVLGPLGLAELAIRLKRGALLQLGDVREAKLDLLRSAYPAEYHPTLGYAPTPDYAGADNAWGTQVTIDSRGLRTTPNPPEHPPRTILAVGDSFTFGDQVDDDGTWPSHLQHLTGLRVLNAGVFGYGLDQAVLRAELLLAELPVDEVILSIYPDDVSRCQYSCRYAPKPYFTLADDGLQLHNTPVPQVDSDTPSLLKRALSHSHLVDELADSLAPTWWYGRAHRERAHKDGLQVALRLLDRLLATCNERQVALRIVLQTDAQLLDHSLPELTAHAHDLGIPCLDLVPLLTDAFAQDPDLRTQWFDGHMTSDGNRWVAERLRDALDDATPDDATPDD